MDNYSEELIKQVIASLQELPKENAEVCLKHLFALFTAMDARITPLNHKFSMFKQMPDPDLAMHRDFVMRLEWNVVTILAFLSKEINRLRDEEKTLSK